MICIKPVWIKNDSYEGEVACGQCIACRVNRKNLWSMRCTHELYNNPKSLFATLTYDSSLHYPQAYSLEKKHLQLFIKRLRKSIEPRKIRYFASGEYGDRTLRPHYHIIVYGIGLDEKYLVMDAWPYADWNVPAIRKNAFGIAERHSIQYVAKYIEKMFTGKESAKNYKETGREPVFKVSSLGLGREWAQENAQQYESEGFITFNGRRVSIPRYYVNRTGIDTTKAKEFAIQKECEKIEEITGVYAQKDVFNQSACTKEMILIDDKQRKDRTQTERNAKARISLHTRKL